MFKSSTFISIILAFLIYLGMNNQKVDIVQNPKVPDFSNIIVKSPSESDNVKIDAFDDLSCSDCDDFVKNTLADIRKMGQETNDISLQLYFIPDINNEMNYDAAISLKCASDQGKFWEMLDKIHENKNDLNKKSFLKFGKELEMNTDALQECISEDIYKSAVEADVQYASEKNITFKPSLIINGTYLIGNVPFENIQKVITKSLKDLKKSQIPSPK